MKPFGQWMREQREARGWSQREMARQAFDELSAATVSLVEQGKRSLSYAKLEVVAKAFDVSLSDIYAETDASDMLNDAGIERPHSDVWQPKRVADSAVVLGDVHAKEGVVIEHHVVIDGSHALVVIGENSLIGAGSVIDTKVFDGTEWHFGSINIPADTVIPPNSVRHPDAPIVAESVQANEDKPAAAKPVVRRRTKADRRRPKTPTDSRAGRGSKEGAPSARSVSADDSTAE